MIVFTDLDGTLFDSYRIKKCCMADWLKVYTEAPIMPGAPEAIAKLNDMGCNCMAITARGQVFSPIEHAMTKSALKKYFKRGHIKGLIWHVRNKCESIMSEHDDIAQDLRDNSTIEDAILIDDDLKQVSAAAYGGIFTILFGRDDEELRKEYPSTLRVAMNWPEAVKIIEERMIERGLLNNEKQ